MDDMKCSFELSLKAWLDGELSASRSGEVARHVESCSSCAAACADYRAVSACLRSAAAAVPPLPLEALRARWELVRRDVRDERIRTVRVLRRVAAVAAAVLVVALGVIAVEETSGGRATSDQDALGRDAAIEIVLSSPGWGGEWP